METRERRKSRIEARPWDATDRALLRKYVQEGYDSIAIARITSRSRADVIAETERLGLNDEYEPDPMENPITTRSCLGCGKEFKHRSNRICPRCKERVDFNSPAIGAPCTVARLRRKGGQV